MSNLEVWISEEGKQKYPLCKNCEKRGCKHFVVKFEGVYYHYGRTRQGAHPKIVLEELCLVRQGEERFTNSTCCCMWAEPK